jgi:hypothetical protein
MNYEAQHDALLELPFLALLIVLVLLIVLISAL